MTWYDLPVIDHLARIENSCLSNHSITKSLPSGNYAPNLYQSSPAARSDRYRTGVKYSPGRGIEYLRY